MKKTLLSLSVAMLCGVSMHAQTANSFVVESIAAANPIRTSLTTASIDVTVDVDVAESKNVDSIIVNVVREEADTEYVLGTGTVEYVATMDPYTLTVNLDKNLLQGNNIVSVQAQALYKDGEKSDIKAGAENTVIPAYVYPNNFDATITAANALRLSETDATIDVTVDVDTQKSKNVASLDITVLRVTTEGELVVGSYPIDKYIATDNPFSVKVDLNQNLLSGITQVYAEVVATYKDGEKSAPVRNGVYYVPAYVNPNSFDAAITAANSQRLSEDEATLDVTVNVNHADTKNVASLLIEVVRETEDGEYVVLGEYSIDPYVATESPFSVKVDLTENLLTEENFVYARVQATYKDGEKSDYIENGEYMIPAWTDTPTGVDLVGADNGEAVYYNLQGAHVANPENGIYIRVLNGKAQKIMVK